MLFQQGYTITCATTALRSSISLYQCICFHVICRFYMKSAALVSSSLHLSLSETTTDTPAFPVFWLLRVVWVKSYLDSEMLPCPLHLYLRVSLKVSVVDCFYQLLCYLDDLLLTH